MAQKSKGAPQAQTPQPPKASQAPKNVQVPKESKSPKAAQAPQADTSTQSGGVDPADTKKLAALGANSKLLLLMSVPVPYQALCLVESKSGGPSNMIFKPLAYKRDLGFDFRSKSFVELWLESRAEWATWNSLLMHLLGCDEKFFSDHLQSTLSSTSLYRRSAYDDYKTSASIHVGLSTFREQQNHLQGSNISEAMSEALLRAVWFARFATALPYAVKITATLNHHDIDYDSFVTKDKFEKLVAADYWAACIELRSVEVMGRGSYIMSAAHVANTEASASTINNYVGIVNSKLVNDAPYFVQESLKHAAALNDPQGRKDAFSTDYFEYLPSARSRYDLVKGRYSCIEVHLQKGRDQDSPIHFTSCCDDGSSSYERNIVKKLEGDFVDNEEYNPHADINRINQFSSVLDNLGKVGKNPIDTTKLQIAKGDDACQNSYY